MVNLLLKFLFPIFVRNPRKTQDFTQPGYLDFVSILLITLISVIGKNQLIEIEPNFVDSRTFKLFFFDLLAILILPFKSFRRPSKLGWLVFILRFIYTLYIVAFVAGFLSPIWSFKLSESIKNNVVELASNKNVRVFYFIARETSLKVLFLANVLLKSGLSYIHQHQPRSLNILYDYITAVIKIIFSVIRTIEHKQSIFGDFGVMYAINKICDLTQIHILNPFKYLLSVTNAVFLPINLLLVCVVNKLLYNSGLGIVGQILTDTKFTSVKVYVFLLCMFLCATMRYFLTTIQIVFDYLQTETFINMVIENKDTTAFTDSNIQLLNKGFLLLTTLNVICLLPRVKANTHLNRYTRQVKT